MRGLTPSWASAASRALRPVYWPAVTPPTMLEVVSASLTPSATRTTPVTGLAWPAMASRLLARVPCTPALPEAVSTSVSRTGLLSGKTVASASCAVQTMPTTAVAIVRMGRVPSLISRTRTP
ncbi:hypothetical protein D3C84_670650 [compost metagenome]